MNYKIRVKNEAESKEAQELFFELGYHWAYKNIGKNFYFSKDDIYLYADSKGLLGTGTKEDKNHFDGWYGKELTIPQLRDMVVLKRNDISDATHTDQDNWKWFIGSDGVGYVWQCGNADNLKQWDQSSLDMVDLKPIKKEVVMKEYLNKLEDGTYKLVVPDSVADGIGGLIEVPGGADTLAGDERTRYFWKHGVGVKGNMLTGCGESLSRYPKWDDCEDSADEWLGQINCEHSRILWQRETLNDKVASAEVARQEFIGAPFSDLPEVNFEAVDDFVGSNVEQTLIDRESTYGSFSDVADTTSKLMGVLLNSKNGKMLPCTHQEALHMICLKMARIVNGDHNFIESWHDISGYAILIENELRATDGATNSRLTYQKAINGKLQDI